LIESRIENLPSKKLVGKSMRMSLAQDSTTTLWSYFMPIKKLVKNIVNSDLFSMQVYDKSLKFVNFNTETNFTKWAAIEVSDFKEVPEGLSKYTLEGGLYAVFIHKEQATEFPKTFQFIFREWLPNSNYELDQREHFELLGDKYSNFRSDSEEEVWIPIKKKLE